MADSEEQDDRLQGPLRLKSIIKVVEERTVPLGPFAGTMLVDLQQEIEELHEQYFEQLDAKGIGTVRIYERAEWTGVFTYEVEIHLQVAWLYGPSGEPVEELQAGWGYVVAVVIAVAACWVSSKSVTITDNVFVKGKEPFTVFAVALGIGAIAFLVWQMRKYRSIGAT